jgi:hypothetical protein
MAIADIYKKATLVQIPSGYKSGTLYSVVPNTADGDFTVSADADATRVNKDGLIESTVANQARLNYDFDNPQDPHLLLEPTRTNYTLNSNDASQWAEIISNGTVTTTANYSTAPDGSNEATRLQASVSGSGYATLLLASTTAFTGSYSSTVYVKSNTGSNQTVAFYGRNSTTNLHTVTNEWTRIETIGSTTSGLDAYSGLGVNTGYGTQSNPIDILVWGGQLEAGTYSTSIIPTSGIAVTRTADSNEVASGLENIIGQTEGTVFIDFEYLYETTTDSSTDALRDIFVVGTAADISEGISIDNYRSQFRVFVQGSGMTTQSIGNNTTGASQPNTRYKLAVKYKTGDCKAYLNGSLLGSSTGTVSFATDLDGIFFSYNDSSRLFKNQKKVYQLMIFNEALSDAELITLTS